MRPAPGSTHTQNPDTASAGRLGQGSWPAFLPTLYLAFSSLQWSVLGSPYSAHLDKPTEAAPAHEKGPSGEQSEPAPVDGQGSRAYLTKPLENLRNPLFRISPPAGFSPYLP